MGLIASGERLSVKESRGQIDQFVGEGNVALLAVLLALKQSRKFQTGNRQSQPGRIQRGKTKSSRRGKWREREREWKMERWVARGKKRIYCGSSIERVLPRGQNADSLFNAFYGLPGKDSIKANLHYCLPEEPIFFCIVDYVTIFPLSSLGSPSFFLFSLTKKNKTKEIMAYFCDTN